MDDTATIPCPVCGKPYDPPALAIAEPEPPQAAEPTEYKLYVLLGKGITTADRLNECLPLYEERTGRKATHALVNQVDGVCDYPGLSVRASRYISPGNIQLGSAQS